MDVPQVVPRSARPAVPVTPHLPIPLPPPPLRPPLAPALPPPPPLHARPAPAPPPPPPAAPVVPEQPHPDWATGTVTVLGPSYVAPPPSRWEPLLQHRVRILQVVGTVVVVLLAVLLWQRHQAGVRAEALKTVTADLQTVAQFEHMARVYDDSYASRGQLLRNGWTPGAATLTFSVVPRSYCVTASLHGVSRTVREDEVISTRPC